MSPERWVVLMMMVVNGLVLYLIEGSWPVSEAPGKRRRSFAPNLALTGLLLALNFALDLASAAAGVEPRGTGAGFAPWTGRPAWAEVLLVVLALDGLTYVAHVLMHELPPAWRFHRVHHSDAQVDVTTAFRQHPIETVWRYSFLCAGALALGASTRAVAIYLALSALNAQLEHADVSLPWRVERVLRLVIATPAMHRVHHSRVQVDTDTNYSNIFSFWDRLFGTYRAPRAGERIDCGLDECDAPGGERTVGLLALPFR